MPDGRGYSAEEVFGIVRIVGRLQKSPYGPIIDMFEQEYSERFDSSPQARVCGIGCLRAAVEGGYVNEKPVIVAADIPHWGKKVFPMPIPEYSLTELGKEFADL